MQSPKTCILDALADSVALEIEQKVYTLISDWPENETQVTSRSCCSAGQGRPTMVSAVELKDTSVNTKNKTKQNRKSRRRALRQELSSETTLKTVAQ